MAKQATSFGTDAWAFGPGSNGGTAARAVLVRETPAPADPGEYGKPAVFLSGEYSQPARFLTEADEAPAAERHVWDQLPEERRRRRGRRYVGKHRA